MKELFHIINEYPASSTYPRKEIASTTKPPHLLHYNTLIFAPIPARQSPAPPSPILHTFLKHKIEIRAHGDSSHVSQDSLGGVCRDVAENLRHRLYIWCQCSQEYCNRSGKRKIIFSFISWKLLLIPYSGTGHPAVSRRCCIKRLHAIQLQALQSSGENLLGKRLNAIAFFLGLSGQEGVKRDMEMGKWWDRGIGRDGRDVRCAGRCDACGWTFSNGN